MRVAGFDLSLTGAGIAVLRDGRPVMLASPGHGESGAKSWQHRELRITSQTRAVTAAIQKFLPLDLAAVEAPLVGKHVPNVGDSYDRFALFVAVCSQLRAWGVPYAVVNNKTRAAWATGRGDSKKPAVLAAVRATWKPWAGHVLNDNIADALALAEMCARQVGEELHFPITRAQSVTLTKTITWPELVTA